MSRFRMSNILGLGLICVISLVGSLSLTTNGVGAQATPLPVECNADPRTIREITELASTQAVPPTAFDDANAEEIDQLLTSELMASVAGAVECANANDPLRALSFFSDRYIAERFGSEHPDDLASLTAAASRVPVDANEEDRLTIDLFANGLIDSMNHTVRIDIQSQNRDTQYVDQLILVNVDKTWLIDSWTEVSIEPATPTAGT